MRTISTPMSILQRAKEYAESNGIDMEMIARGCDIRFSREGIAVKENETETLEFLKQTSWRLEKKLLKSTGVQYLCPVEALAEMRRTWPATFLIGRQENFLTLFRWASGSVIKRLEVQHLLQQAATGVGLPADRFLSRSCALVAQRLCIKPPWTLSWSRRWGDGFRLQCTDTLRGWRRRGSSIQKDGRRQDQVCQLRRFEKVWAGRGNIATQAMYRWRSKGPKLSNSTCANPPLQKGVHALHRWHTKVYIYNCYQRKLGGEKNFRVTGDF